MKEIVLKEDKRRSEHTETIVKHLHAFADGSLSLLDKYEVRNVAGWYLLMTLCMAAQGRPEASPSPATDPAHAIIE
ncbi:MAG TPA: hypothetical protein VE954_17930 [Oligoflexus sp.]|nr:hypothetical protein [Oligoflexus sp.]